MLGLLNVFIDIHIIMIVVQGYYPERLAKLFILNMPRFFVSVWKMISRFLDKATLEKVSVYCLSFLVIYAV